MRQYNTREYLRESCELITASLYCDIEDSCQINNERSLRKLTCQITRHTRLCCMISILHRTRWICGGISRVFSRKSGKTLS